MATPPMWRSLALALVLTSSLFVAPALSQTPMPIPGTPTAPTVPTVNTGVPGPEAERPAAPLVWGVAILCTLVILYIVCMPSRKG